VDRADRLAEIAVELAVRIRDDEPTAVHRWLRSEMDGEDWLALAVVLAAAVPVDEPWSQLTAWTWLRPPDTPEKIFRRQQELVEALAQKS